jgi:hypothetical protein
MLVPVTSRRQRPRKPANVLRVTDIADDFDAVDDDLVAMFEGQR